jgi:uncharacterized protein YggT (Ycf19 family)
MTDYDRTTVRETVTDGTPVVRDTYARDRVVTRDTAYRPGPTGGEVIRRAVILLFGILQGLIILRIILLLLGANLGNDIVSFIVGITDPFVEPFRTMFAFDRAEAGDQVLDIAAIVALIGWTLLELLIIAILSLFARRGEDATV